MTMITMHAAVSYADWNRKSIIEGGCGAQQPGCAAIPGGADHGPAAHCAPKSQQSRIPGREF